MLSELVPVLPEIVLLAAICFVLLVDLWVPAERSELTYLLTQGSLLVTLATVLLVQPEGRLVVLDGAYVSDALSVVLKVAILVVSVFVFVYSRPYLQARGMMRGEYMVLGLAGILGMLIMASGHNMLSLYLGLELMALCQYALVAFRRDSPRASEAAMKYFVLGTLASGLLLYGMSLVYGLTGELDVMAIHNHIVREGADNVGLLLGMVFIVAGLAFKLGAVPFHAWVPDVYEGAPTAVTLYIGAAPKIAAFVLVMRLLVDGLEPLHGDWQLMLAALAVASLVIGNVVAIAQTNLKRMLAYSTISHIGFILLGLLAGTTQGYASAMFYVIVYAASTAAAFGMIILLSRRGHEAEEIADFKGLNERSPWFAVVMLVVMFSMAGIPPFAGFYAKLSVLRAVVEVDIVWLAVVAVVASIIGAFYYLRVVKTMYFDQPSDDGALQPGLGFRSALSINGLAIVAFGFYPAALMSFCLAAVAW